MKFNKNILALAALALVAFVAMTSDACAASVMDTAMRKLGATFTSVRTIVFLLGGFGLVGVAFAAIFGKVNWKWFAGLAVGLAVLAAASAVVKYSAGEGMEKGSVQDTFDHAAGGTY